MEKLQEKVKTFTEKNQLKHSPYVSALDLTSEVGEVAKEILESSNYGEDNPKYSSALENEIGDAFYSLICLANCFDIDLEQSLDKALNKYKERLQAGGASNRKSNEK